MLGRVAVKTDPYLIKSCIKNKNVMVTGAGGSIGSELSRQIIMHSPKKIILLEQSEYFYIRLIMKYKIVMLLKIKMSY